MNGHVVIVHPMDSFHPEAGGGIRYMMNILHVFVAQGYLTTVVGYRIAEPSEQSLWRQISLCGGGAGKWVQFLLYLYARLPFIRLPRTAVVVAHRMDCMLAFVLFKKAGPKILISAAPMYYLRLKFHRLFPAVRWFYQLAERMCISGIDVLVPVDEATERYYRQRYPLLGDRIVKIPSSIDLQLFQLQDQRSARATLGLPMQTRIVIFAGRLSPVKNVSLLVRSFEIVRQRIPDSYLLIVGEGEDGTKLRGMAANCKHVVFTGAVTPDRVSLYLCASDVLALCSIEEGSPTVVKEALACGLPVVSTDVGDVRSVLSIDRNLGTIAPADDEGFAEALIGWLLTTSSEEDVRTSRRLTVQQYDVNRIGVQLVRLCRELHCQWGAKR